MTPQDMQLFTQATQLASSNPAQCYSTLKELVVRYPADPNLLAWLVFTAPSYNEKETWLNRALTVAPTDSTVQAAAQWFAGQPKPQPEPVAQFDTSPAAFGLGNSQTVLEAFSQLSPVSEPGSAGFGSNSGAQQHTNLYTLRESQGSSSSRFKKTKVKPDAGSSEDLANRASLKRWLIPAIIAGVITTILLGVGAFFWFTSPNYVEYFKAEDIMAKADRGTYAKFKLKLDVGNYRTNEQYEYYGWATTAYLNKLVKEPEGIFLRFDRANPKIRPSAGDATYYVKIGDPYNNSKLLVVDVMKVEGALERDYVPLRDLPQITLKRAIRTNFHQALGYSNNQAGRFWLVIDVEVTSPKSNPNVTPASLWADIYTAADVVLVNNSGTKDYRSWVWREGQPKSTPNDSRYIIAGQLIVEVQADWKEAYFAGTVGNADFNLPINLTK